MRAQGASTAEACRRIAVSEQTYYRWRKEYGGLKTAEARCMRLARECQALIVVRQLRHEDVLAALAELFERLENADTDFVGRRFERDLESDRIAERCTGCAEHR